MKKIVAASGTRNSSLETISRNRSRGPPGRHRASGARSPPAGSTDPATSPRADRRCGGGPRGQRRAGSGASGTPPAPAGRCGVQKLLERHGQHPGLVVGDESVEDPRVVVEPFQRLPADSHLVAPQLTQHRDGAGHRIAQQHHTSQWSEPGRVPGRDRAATRRPRTGSARPPAGTPSAATRACRARGPGRCSAACDPTVRVRSHRRSPADRRDRGGWPDEARPAAWSPPSS